MSTTTKAAHTWKPRLSTSPWTLAGSTEREKYIVKDASGYEVAETLCDYTTDYANARLIAAAPEMLEALEAALPFMERFIRHTENAFGMATAEQLKSVGDIKAAIQKARGGQ